MNGWRVHNLACSLGRPADHWRRREELLKAAARIEFRTTIMSPLAKISSSDDLMSSVDDIAAAVIELIDSTAAEVVVSPHPHDGHHGHEAVARGVCKALAQLGNSAPRWWMWGLWSDLPIPTIYAPFGHAIMGEVRDALASYVGENARNQYDRLYPARASAYAVLGAERVFGYGSPNTDDHPYADLLTEVQYVNGRWHLGQPRLLCDADALHLNKGKIELGEDITWWVNQRSVTTTRRHGLTEISAA
jgi:LmbE family N-acetylglucosaminyl deacetylase